MSDRELARRDALYLALAFLLLIGTGLGWRDPWPADEPRFALVARDMVLSGDWLFPRIGGDLYHDKPPLYFWLLAVGYWLTGSIRASFLMPSFLAAGGIVFLTYRLARALAGRAAAFLAAALLLASVQFLMVSRGAQIDTTLCFLTTLSLYGLCRHLFLGPAWGWYFIGGLAAGLGVITKGVGFLPLLILLPYALMRARGFTGLAQFKGGPRWWLAPLGLLLGTLVWFVPMMLAVAHSTDPALRAYRDAILFQQTVHRYAAAWHHVAPWYYFIVEVIPPLWFPGSLLLIWLVPHWRQAWARRDAREWLPLAWVVLVVLFFSASPGKRGVYLFPALPAFVLAAAPALPRLLERRGWALAARIWVGALLALALVWSYGVTERLNGERSGRDFMRRAMALAPAGREVALLAAKEQFFLYLDRPVVNFGHGRWVEGSAEAYDAARWLNAAPGRMVLVPSSLLAPCFTRGGRQVVGASAGEEWSWVTLPASADCARQGNINHAILYVYPRFLTGS